MENLVSEMRKFVFKSKVFNFLRPRRRNGKPMKRRTWKKRMSRDAKELRLGCKRAKHSILQELDRRGWYLDCHIGDLTHGETK